MTADTRDPLIHVPARLQIMATLATLPDGDALSFTRLQDMIGLTKRPTPAGGEFARRRDHVVGDCKRRLHGLMLAHHRIKSCPRCFRASGARKLSIRAQFLAFMCCP